MINKQSKWWVMLVIIGAGLVFIAGGVCIMLFHISENRFVDTELPDWKDAYATIEDAWITREHIDSMEDSSGRREYKVAYEYIISFMTSKGQITLHDTRENSGKTEDDTIPRSAYNIFEPGEELAICYNPGNPENYRFGSKQENTARAKSPVMPILAAVFCLIGISAIILGPLFIKRPALFSRGK